MSPLISPAALFRMRFSCPRREILWPSSQSQLDERCRLPNMAGISGVPDIMELFVAWNPNGLAIRAIVTGVGSSRWCAPTRPEDSDGLHLWIATRPTGQSHRAGRYCRRLALLPAGGGAHGHTAVALAAVIPRTSEPASLLENDSVMIDSAESPNGWRIDAWMTAEALFGWDPTDNPRIGFFAAVVDRHLGHIPYAGAPDLPWESDPSLWCELDLKDR